MKQQNRRPISTEWWVWLIASVLFLAAVQVAFCIPAPIKWLEAAWEAGDLITFVGTVALGFVAWQQSRMANDINSKLIAIESNQYKMETRPFAMITDYSLTKGEILNIIMEGHKNLVIWLDGSGGVDNLDVFSLSLSLTNTTQSYIAVQYSSATIINDNNQWQLEDGDYILNKLQLQPKETKRIVFFAPLDFYQSMISEKVRIRIILENRFGARYAEYFEIIILELPVLENGHVNGITRMVIQDFKICKFEKDNNNNIVEIPEEL